MTGQPEPDSRTASLVGPLDPLLVRILEQFCRPPQEVNGSRDPAQRPNVLPAPITEDPLERLHDAFPELRGNLAGSIVVDFGCGTGEVATSLSSRSGAQVLGVDINRDALAVARSQAASLADGRPVTFREAIPRDLQGSVDFIISQDAMEHYSDPEQALGLMHDALAPGGRALITFSPPWLHPYGGHMHFFTPLPWVHLLFPERVVMQVRQRYRTDDARHFEEIEGGLNRMTVAKFENLVEDSGFIRERLRLTPIRGVPFVTRVPGLREFLTTQVDAVLRKS